ncbi:thioredoxin domain-containing protein [Candidatus Berkelbacteria bacterium]|nr:thioredoxin domain-containing protein [Candidatus Berkelbacteria bacterium]
MNQFWPWFFAVGATVLLVVGIIMFDTNQRQVSGTTSAEVATIKEGEWTTGPNEAPVTLIEYSDFQCPACGNYFPTVETLKQEFGDQLRFVYRHYPLKSIHKHAESTAKAAEAAGLQGKFWEMHSQLFTHQTDWSKQSEEEAQAIFRTYGKNIGLNLTLYDEAFSSNAVNEAINDDIRTGDLAKISGTPTFILNGEYIKNPSSLDEFRGLIRAKIGAPDKEVKDEE